MRMIAEAARSSVPTVELYFGTKANVLKVALDVAVAGDDDQVPVLQRDWAQAIGATTDVDEFLAAVGEQLGQAQVRAAGLQIAADQAAPHDTEIAALAADRDRQRRRTAAWIVDRLLERRPLWPDLGRADAIDTVWVLMDPAVFRRITSRPNWTAKRYSQWFAQSVARLLLDGPRPADSRPTGANSARVQP